MSEPIAVNDNAGQTTGSAEQTQDAKIKVTTTADGIEEVTASAKRERNELPKNLSSISDFLARNQVSGFARTNRYFVQFPLDSIFPGLLAQDAAKYLSFLCESVDFPGRDLSVSDNRIYGPVYKTPTISTYPDVNMTFMCDSSLFQKQLFEEWMNKINPNTTFDFNYRDNYTTDIIISQLNELNEVMHTVMLHKAFPTSVGSLQSTWSDDAFHKIQVTFAYDYWDSQVEKVPESVQYDQLRQNHILDVYNGFTKSRKTVGSRDADNLEHLRKVLRAADDSSSRFKSTKSESEETATRFRDIITNLR